MSTRAGDFCLADRNEVFFGGDLHLVVIRELILEKKDGVVIADGGFEQSLGVVAVARSEDDEARKIAIDGLDAVGVLGRNLGGSAVGTAEDDRHLKPVAGHVIHL